jgi:hypothetical protein
MNACEGIFHSSLGVEVEEVLGKNGVSGGGRSFLIVELEYSMPDYD